MINLKMFNKYYGLNYGSLNGCINGFKYKILKLKNNKKKNKKK